jgi:hypothetical protein
LNPGDRRSKLQEANTREAQLSLIREVAGLLDAAGVQCWLYGGWGVDFLLGEVSRPHGDIEFVVWERDRERLKEVLREHGYQLVDDRVEDVISSKHGQLVEFYFIRCNETGEVVTPEKWEGWPWPEGAFSGETGRLGGVRCPVVSAETQLRSKEEYLSQTGAPPRPKDVEDMRRLRDILASRDRAQGAGGRACGHTQWGG